MRPRQAPQLQLSLLTGDLGPPAHGPYLVTLVFMKHCCKVSASLWCTKE